MAPDDSLKAAFPPIGEQIRLRRNEIGLSQVDVGRLAGVHRVTIRAVETGKAVEDKTLANVKRALGCKPGVHYADVPQIPRLDLLRPVLSVTSTRILTKAIAGAPEDEFPVMAGGYVDLVDSLAGSPPGLPAGFDAFLDSLQKHAHPAEVQMVERDVEYIAGRVSSFSYKAEPLFDTIDEATPQANAVKIPRLPNSLVGAVVQSGLSAQIQNSLLDVMLTRQNQLRARMAAQLGAEASAAVKVLYEALASSGHQGKKMDDPDVIHFSERVLSAAVENVFALSDAGRAG